MTNTATIPFPSNSGQFGESRQKASGLAPVTCYDPYFSRLGHYLRAVLADGHPVLARLHSAAEYPTADESMYKIDLEGHGILIIGYDDERRAFAAADPWDRRWGGQHSGIRWIGYNELSLVLVDSSLGAIMVLSPLDVTTAVSEDGDEPVLTVSVGFYEPRAIVMDRANQEIRNVRITVTAGEFSATVRDSGQWKVGQNAVMKVKIPASASDINIQLVATVAGQRPYPYEDEIGVELHRDRQVRRGHAVQAA
jgi:hypothetical protein